MAETGILAGLGEPEESTREHHHLEADILQIDQEALAPAAKRPWPQGRDLVLSNLEDSHSLTQNSSKTLIFLPQSRSLDP